MKLRKHSSSRSIAKQHFLAWHKDLLHKIYKILPIQFEITSRRSTVGQSELISKEPPDTCKASIPQMKHFWAYTLNNMVVLSTYATILWIEEHQKWSETRGSSVSVQNSWAHLGIQLDKTEVERSRPKFLTKPKTRLNPLANATCNSSKNTQLRRGDVAAY